MRVADIPTKTQIYCLVITSSIIHQEAISKSGMENLVTIIPMFGHFLNNTRHLEIKATATDRNQKINKRAKDDFKLCLKFLEWAHAGVNMNLMTFRKPNKTYINDASEHGLGGFSTHGKAWS